MGFSIQCKNEVQFIFSEDSANVFPASALEISGSATCAILKARKVHKY